MRYLQCILVIAAFLALTACGGGGSTTATGTGIISLNGGTGGTGPGGNGGKITTLNNYSSAVMGNFSSVVHGDLRFHAGGAVPEASFTVPNPSPSFGNISTNTTIATISSDTQVQVDPVAPAVGTYFISTALGDHNLYFESAAGKTTVIGLTVNPSGTLSLPNANGHTMIPKAVLISGTVTTVSPGEALNLQSGTLIEIGPTGKVTTQPTTAGTTGGQINLHSGGTLINTGKVDGSNTAPGGGSGGVTLEAATFLYVDLTGTVNAKGGEGGTGPGGNGGPIQLLADTATVYASGVIDASGGSGASGGNSGSITISGGRAGVGRVALGGTVTGNGGTGSAGSGGNGAAMTLNSFSGGVFVSAVFVANGGDSKNGGNGGNGGALRLINNVSRDIATQHQLSPEGIKVFGNITMDGGNGPLGGGDGGTIAARSDVEGTALSGFSNVEFFGYQFILLNGGGSTSGSGGDGGTLLAVVASPPVPIVGVDIPAGGVYNEVGISVRGGDNNPGGTTKSAGSMGGNGGTVTFLTPQSNGSSDPARSLVTNSGAIDVSGGAADTGGAQGGVTMTAYGNVTNAGAISAIGGIGVSQGGGIQGAVPTVVTMSSANNVSNSGAIVASGGNGVRGGNAGGVFLSSGNLTTNSGIIAASGGISTAGGNGGFITLDSELAFVNNVASLNVVKGSSTGTNGTITINGIDITPPAGFL